MATPVVTTVTASKEMEVMVKALTSAAGPVHIDEIIRTTGIDSAKTSSVLALMEIDGLVRQVAPMKFEMA